MNIHSIGKKVREERKAIGMSQEELASLANLTRVTIGNLESGKLHDLGFEKIGKVCDVLGLDLAFTTSAPQKNWLKIAAKTASTSYTSVLTPIELSKIMATGVVPEEYKAHMISLIDEAPKAVLYGAIKEASVNAPPRKIMANIRKMAKTWQIKRFS